MDENSKLDSSPEPEQSDKQESASSGPTPESPLAPPAVKSLKPKTKNQKLLVTVLVVLLVLAAVAAGWFYWQRRDSSKSDSTKTTDDTSSEEETIPVPTTQDTVAYAFKAQDNVPFSLFWRPAAGGDRTEIQKLGGSESITDYDAEGSTVVFASDSAIYVSTDAGKSYKSVYSLPTGAQITSLKLSAKGDKIAFGLLPESGKSNTVKSMGLDGKDEKDLFTAEKAGAFIYGWSDTKQKIIYDEGCYNCDGPRDAPVLRDLAAGSAKTFINDLDNYELTGLAVSDDFKKVIYGHATSDANQEFIGAGPPYEFKVLDLGSNETVSLAKVGEEGGKTYVSYLGHPVGFVAENSSPYYSYDNQIYIAGGDKQSLFYQSDKKLLNIQFVSNNYVIAATGDDTSDFTLNNYNVETKEAKAIFQGDNNTVIFGVTTK